MGQLVKFVIVIALFTITCATNGDTFTNRRTGEKLTGFAVPRTINAKTIVRTEEKGRQDLSLAGWDVEYNKKGRENRVPVIGLNEPIVSESQVEAIEKLIIANANQGPLFILLEINLTSGRSDLVRRLCAAICKVDRYTPVYGYITGKPSGKALNEGAVIALACRKIYLSPDVKIGGGLADPNDNQQIMAGDTLRKQFGSSIGEKFSSANRGFIASLAQQNNRPASLAKAMVDENVQVIEVRREDVNSPLFIEPVNKLLSDKEIKLWSEKGSMLLLDAKEAVQTGIADSIYQTRELMLKELADANAEIIEHTEHLAAKAAFDRTKARITDLVDEINEMQERLKGARGRARSMILRRLIGKYQILLRTAQQNPEFGIPLLHIQQKINSLKAEHRKSI